MRLQVRLTHKGIILIGLPLVLQLVFFYCLYALQKETEAETARANHASRLAAAINKMQGDMMTVATSIQSSSTDIFGPKFDLAEYAGAVGELELDMNHVEEEARGDSQIEQQCTRALACGRRALKIIEEARIRFSRGEMPVKSNSRRQVYKDLRSLITPFLSGDLLSKAKSYQEIASSSPERQARLRDQMAVLLLVAVIGNILVTAVLAWFIGRDVIRRLHIMIDNSYKLASGQALNPVFQGADEIDDLDHIFHGLAEELQEMSRKERAIVENARDVICSLDSKGTFLAASAAAAKVFGYEPQELMGSKLARLVPEEETEQMINQLKKIVDGDPQDQFEIRLRRKDGKIIDVAFSATWSDKESSLFCVARDITEQKQAERLRQEVVAMVSHDLKTPLATIRSFLEMLDAGMFGQLSERGQQLLSLADRSSARMLTLTKDLLDIEKMESGMLELKKSTVTVKSLFEQSVHGVIASANESGVKLEPLPTNVEVYADPDRIIQVLVNLLSNAVKFSPRDGQVTLMADNIPGFVEFRVADQGRGIPAHLHSSIFDRFKQVQDSDSREKGGSGLGLAICKALVELHGGDIRVESVVDEGSTFIFCIPATSSTADTSGGSRGEAAASSSASLSPGTASDAASGADKITV